MRIFKIAQGGGVPAGHVKIRFTIDGGNIDARIIEHGSGTSCGTENDDKLLQDLLDSEVAGFGFVEDVDAGKTSEGYEATRVKAPKVKPLEEKPFGGPFGGAPSAPEKRKLDLGYGV